VKSTVTERVEDRLPVISAQILSRYQLERVVQEFELYPALVGKAPMEDIVDTMRADIGGPIIEPGGRDSFRLSYSSADPLTAQKVTARLASLYLDQNRQDRRTRADQTSGFLEEELADAQKRLIEHEQKLEAYRLRYAGQLPTQLAGNQNVIQNTQLQLQNLNDAMDRARERRLLKERELADARAPLPPILTRDAGSASVPTAAEELAKGQAALERARDRYTVDHPELGAAERLVAVLEKRAAEEARTLAEGKERTSKNPSLAELERQRRVRSLEAELEVIDKQLASQQAEQQRLNDSLARYKSNVDAVPMRESELSELNRGYDVLKAAYDALLLRREEARTAANLEQAEIGEQFSVIDRASLPQRPANEMRRLQLMGGAPVVALLLGLLLVAGLEYLDASFRTEQDVFRALSLPVLALVPSMPTDAEQRSRRRKTVFLDVASVASVIASVGLLIFWRLNS
jgi:polysaccharide chain length determinant protein (PEP-CTERM system associated)